MTVFATDGGYRLIDPEGVARSLVRWMHRGCPSNVVLGHASTIELYEWWSERPSVVVTVNGFVVQQEAHRKQLEQMVDVPNNSRVFYVHEWN